MEDGTAVDAEGPSDAGLESSAPPAPKPAPIGDGDLRAIIAGLSHELCRPLISLRAGFDLLLGQSAKTIPGERRDQVRLMAGICDELLQLTRRYLQFAGLAHGARPLTLGTFSLGAIADDLDRRFRDQVTAAGLRWTCRLDGDGAVTTDVTICQQVFDNLLSNAIKYTPAGGSVAVVVGLESPGVWRFSVSDDGPGIPPDEREKVFTPFYRLGREGAGRPEGHGLGLAISRELAQLLGGGIDLADGHEGGTVVTVTFPVRAPGAPGDL